MAQCVDSVDELLRLDRLVVMSVRGCLDVGGSLWGGTISRQVLLNCLRKLARVETQR